jgi:hypothetical protein
MQDPEDTPRDRSDARLIAGTQCGALAAMVALFQIIPGAWYVRLVPGVLLVVLANFGARLWVRRRHSS